MSTPAGPTSCPEAVADGLLRAGPSNDTAPIWVRRYYSALRPAGHLRAGGTVAALDLPGRSEDGLRAELNRIARARAPSTTTKPCPGCWNVAHYCGARSAAEAQSLQQPLHLPTSQRRKPGLSRPSPTRGADRQRPSWHPLERRHPFMTVDAGAPPVSSATDRAPG